MKSHFLISTFLVIFSCVYIYIYGQADTNQVKFDRLFGATSIIPLDSITNQEIKDKNIIGYWEFSKIKISKKEKQEIYKSNIAKKYDEAKKAFNGIEIKDNHQFIIYKKDTLLQYWKSSENQDTLYILNGNKYDQTVNEYGIPFPIKKLTKHKLLFYVSEFQSEENFSKKKEFYLVFRRRKK